MYNILNEINLENGTNYKIQVLKKHSNNNLLKRLLAMTYDKVTFTYGITMKNIIENNKIGNKYNLIDILDILEKEFCTRKVTGKKAINRLQELYDNTTKENKTILWNVIGRDLKLDIGKRLINKVFKNLIVRPLYMRCGLFSKNKTENGKIIKGTINNITFPAYIQLKADGTYREVIVKQDGVFFNSRSGELYEYPLIRDTFLHLPHGHYIGELTVIGISNRAEGNGLINSDNPPEDKLIFEFWDYITLEEYQRVKNKEKPTISYENRWKRLQEISRENFTNKNIRLIPSFLVNNLEEALVKVSSWMNEGLEGGILKDKKSLFKDGTNKQQLKLKLAIDADVRITGFTEGTKGTSREKYFGAITFETDDKLIQGQTSGFTEKQLKEFTKNKDSLIGKIMEVQFNDITQSKMNDYHSLSHPRFIQIRSDKLETDTYKRVLESRDMAKNLK